MDFFGAMEILSSGMGAERTRMNVTSSNLANANTTRTEAGGPYKRRDPVFQSTAINNDAFASDLQAAMEGVQVVDVVADEAAPRLEYEPGHPDANAEGYVAKPNINLIEEMVNMITAARSYEAGVTAMRSVVEMARRSLTIGQ